MNRMIQFLALLFLLSSISFGQSAPGNITASGTTCGTTNACVVLLQGLNSGSATITLNGTFVATIQFEGTTDDNPTTNTNWYAVQGAPIGSATAVTSASTNNVWTFNTANLTGIRARASAYTSGTAAVIIRASPASASKGGVGGGSSLPSGTQGCDLSNKDGSTGYQTDCSVLKTTDFTSPTYPTFGQAAQACFVAAAAMKTSGAICDGRGELGGRSSESGTPDLDVDPFLAPTAPFQSILLLPCSQVLTEVGMPITGGTPTSNNAKTHGDSHMYGCGEFGDRNNVTDGHAGTTLTAGPLFPACVASSATGLCTTKTGATMTTSVFTTVGNYTQVVTLTLLPAASGYTFTNAIIGSQVIVGTATGNYTYGTITGVTDTTHATVNQGNGQSTAHTGDAFIIEGALTSLGVNSQAGGGNAATYGNTVEKMTLDCNGVAGCIDAQNWYSVEKSGYMHIFFKGYNNIGLDVESTQAQTSGPYDTLFFVPDNGGTGTCTAATLDVVFRNSAPRGLRNSSFANGAGCPNVSTPQSVSVSWDTSLGLGEMLHFENKVVGLGIGAAAVCPVVCPVAVPNPIAANTFTEINASCSNNASAACSTVARVYANVDTTNLINISQSVVNMTNTLVDSQNSNTLTQANNPRVATYFIDTAGKVSYTDANPVSGTEIANAASVCYNGSCNKASSGSLFPVSGPGGSTGNFQYNCSSAFCGAVNFTYPNGTAGQATLAATGSANNVDILRMTRFTDTAPTGNFVNFLSVAAVSQFSIDVSGNLTALSLSTSGTNGGVNFLEGTGAGLTAAAAHDLLFGDSTLHCLHQNLNNSDKGCIPFAFTAPVVNTNGTLSLSGALPAAVTIGEDKITGAGAAASITEGGATFAITRAGIATAALTTGWGTVNTNSSNNNTSIGQIIGAAGSSTGGIAELIFDVSGTGDVRRAYTGGSYAAGVYTVGTLIENLTSAGALNLAGGTVPTVGTSGGWFAIEGTAPTGTSTNYGMYNDSTLHCPDLLAQSVNLGCAVGETAIIAANTITKALGTTSKIAASSITDNASTTAFAEAARGAGVVPYFQITIPADTAQTASTESPGFQTITGTRTWATTGTVALQREFNFAGPTYASAGASQTFTDAFTLYATPPIQGTNAIFTRDHTLGIVDATSAATSITGGVVVATTLGTTATSVGIGGGNVNAGGTITAGNGLVNVTTPMRDQTRFVLVSSMTAVNTAGVNIGSTGASNVVFSWPVTAANWYDMECKLPVTFVSSATIKFQLVSISGSVTISNGNAETMGDTGAAAAFQDLSTIGGTTLANTATPVTGAPGGVSEQITYSAQFLTSHAGNIGLEFIGNATNNVQMLIGGECQLTQIN